MGNRRSAGHLAALFTIIIWGTTFISTKVLLVDFKPVEILFFRFVMGFVALLFVCPHSMKGVNRKQEMTFVLAVKGKPLIKIVIRGKRHSRSCASVGIAPISNRL